MALQTKSDASFFALVHHVLDAERGVESTERRDTRRRKFTCEQFLAPYRDGRLPRSEDFRRVLCRDLSPTGFSFLSPKLPDSEYFIVALGRAPFIFVSAVVMHHSPLEVEGQVQHMVGCRFIARVNEPGLGSVLGSKQS